MKSHGIFAQVNTAVGQIIVADLCHPRVNELLEPNRVKLGILIRKQG